MAGFIQDLLPAVTHLLRGGKGNRGGEAWQRGELEGHSGVGLGAMKEIGKQEGLREDIRV